MSQTTAMLKPLVWTDPAPPNETGCRYDHVTAETPLGQFSIEWKSWKVNDSRDLYLAGEHVKSCHDLDEAKQAAFEHLASLVGGCMIELSPEAFERFGKALDANPMAENGALQALLARPKPWATSGAPSVTVNQALDAFEAAACKSSYDMRGGVKAVMELCAGRELSDPIPLASVPKHKFDCLVDHAKFQDKTIAELRAHCNDLELYRDNAVWHWQHDGQDFLESLTCPVVIPASQLRELLSDKLPTDQMGKPFTYSSTQATNCAGCGKHKHTPLRVDGMDGYVCLTCIDARLEGLLAEESARHVEKDWDGCQEVADLPAVHEALAAFSADSTGDAGVAVVQAVIAALELRKAAE